MTVYFRYLGTFKKFKHSMVFKYFYMLASSSVSSVVKKASRRRDKSLELAQALRHLGPLVHVGLVQDLGQDGHNTDSALGIELSLDEFSASGGQI